MKPYDYVLLPLQEILQNANYEIKKEKSSKRHITMTHQNGEVIIITRKANGHYLYFNPFNEKDKGNIHHFCKNRNLSVKSLIYEQELPQTHIITPTELKENEVKAGAEFKNFKSINLKSKNTAIRGTYLLNRGIKSEIYEHFNIKIDKRNNICFPTYIYEKNLNAKDLSLCGYTAKLNQALTHDTQGNEYKKPIKALSFGKKGLEILKHNATRSLKEIQHLIITETSIDSLSLLQLKNLESKKTLLCATSGSFSQNSQEAFLFLLNNCSKDTKVLIGFDNDLQGQKLVKLTKRLLKDILLDSIIITPQKKDFNEELTNTQNNNHYR